MSATHKSDGEATDTKQVPSMTPKSVTIADPEGSTSYFDLGEPAISASANSPKQHRISGSRRLTGRSSKSSLERLPKLSNLALTEGSREGEDANAGSADHVHAHGRLHGAVSAWLKEERFKWQGRTQYHEKSYAQLAFEGLEKILSEHAITKHQRPVFPGPKKHSSHKRSRRPSLLAHPSDTEYFGDGPIVPTTDEVLDNSKTVDSGDAKETEAWLEFKNEIIRLAHTLRLKGWRRIDLQSGNELDVSRISGALTNAVYVVTPPKNLPQPRTTDDSSPVYVPKRAPVKLLLRVYGPQVGHLIDREKELEILKRLAKKHIGPRLLGTFLNGRFEQFLNAKALNPKDLLDPETSKQIAKRMRELHDGIDLTKEERAAGPFVWQNWDKWVNRCEEVTMWLDKQVLEYTDSKSKSESWKARGFVCGVQWIAFRKTVDNYRQRLKERYGGGQGLRDSLVFAHNDTHSGNILRIEPTGESPLLLPSNEHRQLVVIDFEYANANTPGFEFANHFTEWCYDYHSSHPEFCNTDKYPNPEEQARFIRSYIQHHPHYHISSGRGTINTAGPSSSFASEARIPSITSTTNKPFSSSSSSPLTTYQQEEAARETILQKQITHLMSEARLWRVANSAQWVAWGIVQAKVRGMEEALIKARQEREGVDVAAATAEEKAEEEQVACMPHESEIEGVGHGDRVEGEVDEDDGGFDYLAYTRDRALFFWGDLLEMGIVKESDLPRDVVERAKRIKY